MIHGYGRVVTRDLAADLALEAPTTEAWRGERTRGGGGADDEDADEAAWRADAQGDAGGGRAAGDCDGGRDDGAARHQVDADGPGDVVRATIRRRARWPRASWAATLARQRGAGGRGLAVPGGGLGGRAGAAAEPAGMGGPRT